jgi:hypothetical protein
VVLVYLFVWETTYSGKRPESALTGNKADDKSSDSGASVTGIELKSDVQHNELKADIELLETVEAISSTPSVVEDYGASDRKKTFREQLPIYQGRLTKRSWLRSFVQPFPLMIFPAVVFSTVVNGAFLTWMVISGIISMQVLAYPPYNLQPDMLAYIGLPGSVVGLASAITAGLMNDWMIKKLSKRNGGVYEPEFRLLAMIPATLFTTLGFILTGPAYANHYSVPRIVALGLLFHIGGPFASSACLTYIFDTQGSTITEAFVATSLFKSIFIFFVTKFVPAWFARVGPRYCFNTLAVLNVCFAALTIPMYIYGKRLRGYVSFSSTKNLIRPEQQTTNIVKDHPQ